MKNLFEAMCTKEGGVYCYNKVSKISEPTCPAIKAFGCCAGPVSTLAGMSCNVDTPSCARVKVASTIRFANMAYEVYNDLDENGKKVVKKYIQSLIAENFMVDTDQVTIVALNKAVSQTRRLLAYSAIDVEFEVETEEPGYDDILKEKMETLKTTGELLPAAKPDGFPMEILADPEKSITETSVVKSDFESYNSAGHVSATMLSLGIAFLVSFLRV